MRSVRTGDFGVVGAIGQHVVTMLVLPWDVSVTWLALLLKYTNNLDSVDDITLGLVRSLDEANDINDVGHGWSLTNDDILKW